MDKKYIAIILALFYCFMWLCSCSTNATYNTQEKIKTNYNNISNYCDFWLTNDSICFLDNSLFQKYYLIEKNSKTKIAANGGYGFGKIQRYDNNIYMLNEVEFLDERNSKYELKCYDINSKTTSKICSVKNCENFLVLDNTIYYLEKTWSNNVLTLKLKKFSFDCKQHITINSDVMSFGVIKNSLCYVIKRKNKIAIYKYSSDSSDSVKCGEFLLEGTDTKTPDDFFSNNFKVSYTLDFVLFSWIDYKNETSKILKYSLKNDALSEININGYIDAIVAYDTYSYFITSLEKSENSELFKLENDANKIIKIAKFSGKGSLFVGSDDGAYVLEYNDYVLNYYNGGSSHLVYKF